MKDAQTDTPLLKGIPTRIWLCCGELSEDEETHFESITGEDLCWTQHGPNDKTDPEYRLVLPEVADLERENAALRAMISDMLEITDHELGDFSQEDGPCSAIDSGCGDLCGHHLCRSIGCVRLKLRDAWKLREGITETKANATGNDFNAALAAILGQPDTDRLFTWTVETDFGPAAVNVTTEDSLVIQFLRSDFTIEQRDQMEYLGIGEDGKWMVSRKFFADAEAVLAKMVKRLAQVGWSPPEDPRVILTESEADAVCSIITEFIMANPRRAHEVMAENDGITALEKIGYATGKI